MIQLKELLFMKKRRTIMFLFLLVVVWSSSEVVSEVASQSVIYWTAPRRIDTVQLTNLRNLNVQSIINTGLKGPFDIALDTQRGKIYWTVAGKIQRANLDGTNARNIITGVYYPSDIALDVIAGKVYWIQGTTQGLQGLFNNKICCANLDGTDVQDLISISGLNSVRSITLNVQEGKMYWTEGTSETKGRHFGKIWIEGTPHTAKIRRANLDGTDIQDVITTGDYPAGIALDMVNSKIYWTEYNRDSGRIRCANLDGTNVQDLVDGLNNPNDIALDVEGDKMYWIDTRLNKIQSANLHGIGVQDIINKVFGYGSIAVVRSK